MSSIVGFNCTRLVLHSGGLGSGPISTANFDSLFFKLLTISYVR